MHRTWIASVLAVFVMAGCADEAADGDVEDGAPTVEELTSREPTWEVRLDRSEADEGGFQLVETDEGFDLSTGPAGIFYEPTTLFESGDYTLSATFTERELSSEHAESYGVFIGGRDLQGPGVEYTYFLVRSTGEYLVKRREGDETHDLVDWTSDEAVNAAGSSDRASADRGARDAAEGTADDTADGTAEETADAEPRGGVTNTLAVEVRGDTTRFLVNGTTVETLPTAEARPWGVVGMRANHRLDLEIRDWQAAGGGSNIEPARSPEESGREG